VQKSAKRFMKRCAPNTERKKAKRYNTPRLT
jgi:hypothetical protein